MPGNRRTHKQIILDKAVYLTVLCRSNWYRDLYIDVIYVLNKYFILRSLLVGLPQQLDTQLYRYNPYRQTSAVNLGGQVNM